VVKTDFSLFDTDWSAEEELQLMNALLTQGLSHPMTAAFTTTTLEL
jgi:hypothetical protein